MNCNQCGKEIPENSVFCPFCGVPLKVTADYDYIQGEIGANVDKIKTGAAKKHTSDTAAVKKKKTGSEANDLNKTRNMYGRDTIYEQERRTPAPRQESRERSYRDDYRDDYYDDYDYYDYEYDDWGMESRGGGNAKTIVTTIIIALICLAGIAAVIYFGLKPQDKGTAVDVLRCLDLDRVEVSEGTEFDRKLEVILDSEQGYPIHYTLDGSDVDINSPLYTGSIVVDEPGSVTIRAISFDKKGNPSGEELHKTFTVVQETKETAAEADDETTEAGLSKEEAEKIVENALVESGAMKEDYSTDNDGFINLIHAGETDIDGVPYYVIQADYYDADGSIWETTYYGITMDDGTLSYLEKQGETFVTIE